MKQIRVTVVTLILLLVVPTAFGELVITPSSPTSETPVTIRLQNTFGAEGHVTTASITQVANAFTIDQSVAIECVPPPPPPQATPTAIPFIASDFSVGPLAPGTYTISATVHFTTCSLPPFTQTTSFLVAPAVPAFDARLLWVFVGVLAVLGAMTVRR